FETKRAQKIVYFTPTLAGFSLAASYSPTGTKGRITSPVLDADNRAGAFSNAYSVAGDYKSKFGDFTLQAFVGYTKAHMEAPITAGGPVKNGDLLDGGLIVGWGPFQIGASAENIHNARVPLDGLSSRPLDNRVWDVGVVYTTGPFSASLG